MEGTKLLLTKEKTKPWGILRMYENDFYIVRVVYAGDLPEKGKEKEFSYDPWLLQVSAEPKKPAIPDLVTSPGGEGKRQPYAAIDELLPLPFDRIEEYRTFLLAGKETLEEIDRVVNEAYPNINVIEK